MPRKFPLTGTDPITRTQLDMPGLVPPPTSWPLLLLLWGLGLPSLAAGTPARAEAPHAADLAWWQAGQPEHSSPGSRNTADWLRWLAKRRSFTWRGVPYGLTGLPVGYYSGLSGWNYGGRVKLTDYSRRPFRYKLTFNWVQSTRDRLDLFMRLRIPSLAGTQWGLNLQLDYYQGLRPYYGLGNNTLYDPRLTDPGSSLFVNRDYYSYRIHKPRMLFTLMRPIRYPFFIAAGFGLKHVDIRPPAQSSRLFEEQLFSPGEGSSGLVGVMVRWDTRDDETLPRRGALHEWSYESAHNSLLGLLLPQIGFSRYTFSDIRFFPLTSRLNLANRAVFEIMQGTVPVDVMGDLGGLRRKIKGLGGDETLRGYDTNRFIDRVRYFSNTELRYTLRRQTLLRQYLEWTGVAFVDLGRVWPDLKSLTLAGIHLTGGGGVRAYWNEDFVASLEGRFSTERRLLAFSLGNIF
ncbi:MAG: BamA/TamA family outer membrane protein [Candidatus Latescibacteria bacterium]|nr:BamA/TamA family outer membrane protein [Candidatus Latescibacterota bacterium]